MAKMLVNKFNYPDLVDELAMLIVSVLETQEKYTHEELHKVDRDTGTLYFTELGEEIYNEAVYDVEKVLSKLGLAPDCVRSKNDDAT